MGLRGACTGRDPPEELTLDVEDLNVNGMHKDWGMLVWFFFLFFFTSLGELLTELSEYVGGPLGMCAAVEYLQSF